MQVVACIGNSNCNIFCTFQSDMIAKYNLPSGHFGLALHNARNRYRLQGWHQRVFLMTRQTPLIIETMGMINMTTGDQSRCYVQVEISSFSWGFNNKLFYTRKDFSADRKYFLNTEIFMIPKKKLFTTDIKFKYWLIARQSMLYAFKRKWIEMGKIL